jgi:Raf kinase inhibitor-like YbhB/YbcL family protein
MVKVAFLLSSAAFEDSDYIPVKFTCGGQDISPPLAWSGVPEKTKSLALIVDDPDATHGTFTHWIVYNIPPQSKGFAEALPRQGILIDGSRQGRNGVLSIGYMSPCPPPGKVHHYQFKLYALDQVLSLKAGAGNEQLLKVMNEHILARAEIVGLFEIKNWSS